MGVRTDELVARLWPGREVALTPLGGYPYLGYLVRFGNYTIYHAGDCVPYPGLVSRLIPYNVNVALLPWVIAPFLPPGPMASPRSSKAS